MGKSTNIAGYRRRCIKIEKMRTLREVTFAQNIKGGIKLTIAGRSSSYCWRESNGRF
jgi:hypothetical protein